MVNMTDMILTFFAWSGLVFWGYGLWKVLN